MRTLSGPTSRPRNTSRRGPDPDGGPTMLPPRLIRRLILAPLVVVIAVALIVLFPVLAVVTVVFALVGRLARLSSTRPHAEPAAAVVRGRLARRRDRGAVRVPRSVDRQRVRRPAADRALPEPQLRDHAMVPGPGVPLRHLHVRAADRDRGTAVHGGRTPGAPGAAGDRAQPARGAGRFNPARAPPAQHVRPAPAGGHEGGAAARPHPGCRGQSRAQRVHRPPRRRAAPLHRGDRAAGPRPGLRTGPW